MGHVSLARTTASRFLGQWATAHATPATCSLVMLASRVMLALTGCCTLHSVCRALELTTTRTWQQQSVFIVPRTLSVARQTQRILTVSVTEGSQALQGAPVFSVLPGSSRASWEMLNAATAQLGHTGQQVRQQAATTAFLVLATRQHTLQP